MQLRREEVYGYYQKKEHLQLKIIKLSELFTKASPMDCGGLWTRQDMAEVSLKCSKKEREGLNGLGMLMNLGNLLLTNTGVQQEHLFRGAN